MSALSALIRLSIFCSAFVAANVVYPRYGCRPPHDHYEFCDTSKPIEERVEALISSLTLDEIPFLMVARESPGGNISRLGIPQYDWGANCIHGVQSRCGTGSNGEPRCPTPFPNPNFLGAAFNETLWRIMGKVIGSELRSLWRQGVGENHPPTQLPPLGLDCWSPNINVVRDPRWGRNLETPGEDPFLLGRFGIQVTQGLQLGGSSGERNEHLQAVVTLKHFVANSFEGTLPGPGGPASFPGRGLCPGGKCTRQSIDPHISDYDLASTYLPAFKASVKEGGALGVMCSYNSVNGVPCCANKLLLKQKLRKQWGFQGYVTSDSDAVRNIWNPHFYTASFEDAVVAALEGGTSIESAAWEGHHSWHTGGGFIDHLPGAVRSGRLDEKVVKTALADSLKLRFRLGLFDPPEQQPHEHISPDAVRSNDHLASAVDATAQGLVLLKNSGLNGDLVLPIKGGRIAVIGPHAAARQEILGNYLGQSCPVLDHAGLERFYCVQNLIEAFGNLTSVSYAPGLPSTDSNDTSMFSEAIRVAKAADHIVLALGLNKSIEREGTDRTSIELPKAQIQLFEAVLTAGRPVIVVLINGGAVAMRRIKQAADAIIEAWYPGFFGASAIANAVLGRTNRWGKLPVTIFDESFTTQFDMLDFDMTRAPGRTYRYFTGKPLWPFGFGMSYTNFRIRSPEASLDKLVITQSGGSTEVKIRVENTGPMDGDEVVMAFFTPLPGSVPSSSRASLLQRQLFAFQRLSVKAGREEILTFAVSAQQLETFTDEGDRVSYAGPYRVVVSNGLEELEFTVVIDGKGLSQPLVYELWQEGLEGSREGNSEELIVS